jgi:Acetyl-CoA dehydrogenase C-terminal like
MQGGKGLQLLSTKIQETIDKAKLVPALAPHAHALADALMQIGVATQAAWSTGKPQEALANAVPYMQAFGHTIIAWLSLDVAHCAFIKQDTVKRTSEIADVSYRLVCHYFYQYELPKISAWLAPVAARSMVCADMPEAAF